jgi:hypothetical protein
MKTNKLYNKPGARFRGEKHYGDQPTNGQTNQQSELGACLRLKTEGLPTFSRW